MAAVPETKFVRAGDTDIVYQVFGRGPLHLVVVNGWFTNIDVMWELPEYARCLDRLATLLASSCSTSAAPGFPTG